MTSAALRIRPPHAPSFARSMRDADEFQPEQEPELLLRTFYPASAAELALDLSRVTSLFYGLLLQVAGERLGKHAVDAMSRELFYRLGGLKAQATRDQHARDYPFRGDVRDLVTVLIAAIYNASPEYVFHVERYTAELCSVRLDGVDRYYRAARELGLVEQLRWPTLHPFFEGIRDQLGITCEVESQLLSVDATSQLSVRYTFRAGPA